MATVVFAAVLACDHTALLAWAEKSGCALGPVRIAASSFGGGAGMYAATDIQAGALLFAVPKRLNIGLEKVLGNAACGEAFRARAESGAAMDALCVSIALAHLAGDDPYLSTLPELSATSSVQHWSEAELAALSGSAAYAQAQHVREEAEHAVAFATSLSPLTDEHSHAAIARAVRGAHNCVLSRTFALDEADPSARELIPLLDLLQHHEPPSIEYASEWLALKSTDGGEERLEPCTVARARRSMTCGEELTNSYGDHPSFVFATHYGFVPGGATALAATASGGGEGGGAVNGEGGGEAAAESGWLDERGTWACELSLLSGGDDDMCARVGPSIVLAAQQRTAMMIASGEFVYQPPMQVEVGEEVEEDEEDDEEDECDEYDDEYDDDDDVQFALASLLLEAHGWVASPLRFTLCYEGLAEAMRRAQQQRRPSNAHGVDALLVCARLCALQLDELGPDAEDTPDAEADPNELLDRALRTLLYSKTGRLSEANDQRAAHVLRTAAALALRELEEGSAIEESEGEETQADAQPQAEVQQAQAVASARVEDGLRLAREVKATEVWVLRRLMAGGAEALLGMRG
jgi:hypothetical protein